MKIFSEEAIKSFKKYSPFIIGGVLFVVLVSAIAWNLYEWRNDDEKKVDIAKKVEKSQALIEADHTINEDPTEEEVEDYIENVKEIVENSSSIANKVFEKQEEVQEEEEEKEIQEVIERFSETSTREEGIDESDYIKTNGDYIFISKRGWGDSAIDWINDERVEIENNTVILDTTLSEMSVVSTIPESGQLLLEDNILMIHDGRTVTAYDITDIENPEQLWKNEFLGNTYIKNLRLVGDELYVISQMDLWSYDEMNEEPEMMDPCPQDIVNNNGEVLSLECTDIKYPEVLVSSSTLTSIFKINIEDGEIKENTTFLGGEMGGIVYMAHGNIYVTYNYFSDYAGFYLNALKEDETNFVDEEVMTKLEEIYYNEELKDHEKQSRFFDVLYDLANEMYGGYYEDFWPVIDQILSSYFDEHQRELEFTGIVKIGLRDLDIRANGQIPGRILNEFSIDEDGSEVRLASTMSDYWSWNTEDDNSTNDVYVLNENLEIAGQILDLGVSEQIMGVRFIGDRGYVVTFEQIDPFFVLDMSDPRDPQVGGELKVEGFSSYLYPVKDDLILGIGREPINNGGQTTIKASLYDVSDAENPEEVSKYVFDNSEWTELAWNHRAFLDDSKHEVFFIPGRENGYIFSYENDELSLKKTVEEINPDRAVFVNDYLYVIGFQDVKIYDENTWDEVKEVEHSEEL